MKNKISGKSYRKSGLLLRLALCLLISVQVTGCTKDIQLDLNASKNNIVIEGTVTNQPGPHFVHLSLSQAYYQPNLFPPVTNATVIISDNQGYIDTLEESTPGRYKTDASFAGLPGRTYHLTVVSQGQSYTAQSTMPAAVKIDSAGIASMALLGQNLKLLLCTFHEDAYAINYYRMYSLQNGVLSAPQAIDGQLNNGGTQTGSVATAKEIHSGDSLTVYLQGIDEGVYNYFNSLATNTTNGQTAAPANPVSNISNGALGYFNACSESSRSFIAP